MLPVEDAFDRLQTLSPGDRRAVLARLTPAERRRIATALDAAAAPFAPDIAARIAAPGDAMTAAGRAALIKAAARFVPPSPAGPGPSLLTRLRGAAGGR